MGNEVGWGKLGMEFFGESGCSGGESCGDSCGRL